MPSFKGFLKYTIAATNVSPAMKPGHLLREVLSSAGNNLHYLNRMVIFEPAGFKKNLISRYYMNLNNKTCGQTKQTDRPASFN